MYHSCIPLHYLFWAVLSGYLIHIMEEIVVNGGFIGGVREHIWPTYPTKSFVITNTVMILLITTSILLYEGLGGNWVAFPLMWMIERSLNGLFHIWWSIRFKTYSPGLLTNGIIWIILYLTIKENYGLGDFTSAQLYAAIVIAIVCEIILLSLLWVIPRLQNITAVHRGQ